jgi:bisphosphoglycerate-dependent phosphoglycerate mutase
VIDNIKIIKPLLKFESKDDFYYLQILQRKKENPEIGSNSRVIKNYYISSIDYLKERYDEIKELSNVFNARTMLRLNKRSYEKVAFKSLQNIANSMSNKEYSFIKKSYDRACGESHNDKNKKWILDFDFHLETKDIQSYINYISNMEPIGNKYIANIPSKNGFHLITTPFNIEIFKRNFPQIEIHKDNPVNLYIP